MYKEDLTLFVLDGIKDLYVMTGRSGVWDDGVVINEDDEPKYFTNDLPLDEREYVLVVAQIAFFNKVKTDVNNHVGYTTDALSVTHADKPYRYLSETVRDLESRRRAIWYKMHRYNI